MSELTERQKELRLKYRGELDILGPVDVIVPADAVKRKDAAFCVEMAGFIDAETAWQLLRDAIDEALGIQQ